MQRFSLSRPPTTSGACRTLSSVTPSRIPASPITSNGWRAIGLRCLGVRLTTPCHTVAIRGCWGSMRAKAQTMTSEHASSAASCRPRMMPVFPMIQPSARACARTWNGQWARCSVTRSTAPWCRIARPCHIGRGVDSFSGRRCLARSEPTHFRADLLADIGDMQVNLVKEVGGFLYLCGQRGVLRGQRLVVVGVVLGVQRDLRRDRVGSLCGNEQGSCLNSRQHGEKEVEQYEGIRVKSVPAAHVEQAVEHSPDDHHSEEKEHEGPRSHPIAHPVGSSLPEGELVLAAYRRMALPLVLPSHVRSPHAVLSSAGGAHR